MSRFAPAALFCLVPLAALAQGASPRSDLEAREWTVPWERTRPRDPSVDAKGKIWFVGQVGNYVANLDPVSGKFTRYELDPGILPHNQIVAKDGMVWFSGNAAGMIGKLDPATGKITSYPMPDPAVRDPHTMVFDKAGNIWFTAQQSSVVGRLNPRTGKIDIIKVPPPPNGRSANPYGLFMDHKDRPWFCEFGTNKMAMIDAATMTIREYALPDSRARPRRMAITSDGGIWYGDYSRGYIGRLDPETGKVEEWPSPSLGTATPAPYAMTVDDRDRIWYVETGPRPNRLIGFDAKAKQFVVNQPVGDASANTIRYMVFDAATRMLWYGSDQNMIGRVKVPQTIALVP